MCTCLIAGRKASRTGRVLFAANDDWDGVTGLLTHVERKQHDAGERYTLVGGKTIEQLPFTYGYSYTACKYEIGILDRGWAGGINEAGVAVAGTGANAIKPIPWKEMGYGLEPDDVALLILQRASSARSGVEMIGRMIEEHGMRASGLDGYESGATFMIADAAEGWILEIAPGRVWAAQRVPDNAAAVRVNAFGSCDVDLTDSENVLAAAGLAEYAISNGWWEGDIRHFDFASAFGAETSPNEWGPELDPMNMRRRWRAMDLITGRDSDESERLYCAVPDRQLTLKDLKDILSDVYEGTIYDLTKTGQAGKWGDPFTEDAPSYALCRRGTVSCILADIQENGKDSVMWTALTTPKMSFFFPVFADIRSLPNECSQWDPGKPSLFWSCKEMNMLLQRRYSRHMELFDPVKRKLEQELESSTEILQSRLRSLPEEQARSERTAFTEKAVHRVLTEASAMKRTLLLQY